MGYLKKFIVYPSMSMLVTFVLIGCSSVKPKLVHRDEFGTADMFTYAVPGNAQESCEASRRALLSQGYIISEANDSNVKGRRKFQSDDETHVEIEFNIVCAPNSKGSNSTTIFANAVRDRYSLKKNSSSASLGVGGIGSISLPIGASNDSMVKVASETISDAKLYSRFYDLVERYLDDVKKPDSEMSQLHSPAPQEPAKEQEKIN
ncbi:DUF2242 domain-containing protein [Undibacterium fentianense]|uniref:DUF2242 domain-containing protein n=1 Tax=Undibacterium fentianense TaxID=2828728 RepID=A0A941IFS0_9BURK|nr:DUF2242 domain-containing protein [Undibacterium fentianense]MBR7801016.1 DUF2242 domain-containing protein [Undibacterium fentianense]